MVAIGSRHRNGRVMKEDTIIDAMRRSNQLHRETTFVKEMLISKPTLVQEQEGKTRRKAKAKANDEGEGSNDLPPPKMKPFWKMKNWFEFEHDFRWAMMVGLK